MRFSLSLWVLLAAVFAHASGGPAVGAEVLASATAAQGYQIVEFVRGAPLHGANGTFVGPDGLLYVASVLGGEIVVFDVDRGEVVRRYGSEDGVLGPDDVTFGPDGSLYWTDISAGEVGRRTPDGAVTKQFVAPGVNPITFSPDGRLFVGLCFLDDGLYELDPELLLPPRPIVVASEANPYPLGFFNAFSFGPDGRLYGPLYAAGMVVGIDVDSCESTSQPWADCDVRVLASDLDTPVAAKFDAHGVLHVLDQGTGELFTVALETGDRTLVAELALGLDNLAFDASGRLFVTNADDGSVVEVLAGGAVRTLSPGGLILPTGLVVLERPDGGASLFVGDAWRLQEFDAATGAQIGFRKGSLTGQGMVPPHAISRDGDHLVLSGSLSAMTHVIDPWSGEVLEQHAFGFPYDGVRLGGDLAVVDLVAGGVVWASTRDLILPIDGQQVFLPVGLATDGERLWVSDWATGIVWQLAFDGATALPPVPVAVELANPEGLALDGAGGLLVVEAGARRLSRIDLATGAVEEIAAGLEVGLPSTLADVPSYVRSGVTVDAAGAIYVAGDVANVIYKITRR
jgi:sugar lactone lactonase YvrE